MLSALLQKCVGRSCIKGRTLGVCLSESGLPHSVYFLNFFSFNFHDFILYPWVKFHCVYKYQVFTLYSIIDRVSGRCHFFECKCKYLSGFGHRNSVARSCGRSIFFFFLKNLYTNFHHGCTNQYILFFLRWVQGTLLMIFKGIDRAP